MVDRMNCPPVVAISDKQTAGDYHWRLDRPLTRLREAGVDTAICWLGPDQMPTAPIAGRVVVLQRVTVKGDGPEAARAWVDRLRSAGALAVIFETDDDELTGAEAVHMAATTPLGSADRAQLARTRQALLWTLQACDGATVSTEPLAAVVRRFTDKPVIVVPNAIDVDWFRERLAQQPIDPDHLTIGWTGWRRPDADLEPMAEAWARIAARYPDVRFVVGGHQSDVIYRQPIDLDRIIRLPVAPLETYPRLYQVDIGCCAVADSPFSRCKSPIKAWEYALAGAAVVATSALYGSVIDNRSNGLIAETADAWTAALSWLIETPPLRTMTRLVLQAEVESKYSLTGNIQNWVRAYQSIVADVTCRSWLPADLAWKSVYPPSPMPECMP